MMRLPALVLYPFVTVISASRVAMASDMSRNLDTSGAHFDDVSIVAQDVLNLVCNSISRYKLLTADDIWRTRPRDADPLPAIADRVAELVELLVDHCADAVLHARLRDVCDRLSEAIDNRG